MNRAEATTSVLLLSAYVHRYSVVHRDVAKALLGPAVYAQLQKDPLRNRGPTPGTYYTWSVVDYVAGFRRPLPPEPNVKKLDEAIRRLIETRAVHRRGYVLADMTPGEIVNRMEDEVHELMAEINLNSPETAKDELGDVLAIVLHLGLTLGMTQEELEQKTLAKLKTRFIEGTEDGRVPPARPGGTT